MPKRLTNTELNNTARSKNNGLQARVSPAFNTAIGIFKLSLMVCTSTTLNSSSLASAPNKI
uniref:Uncharacterized protein n=1 Tax=Glossina austeni TaxID=7395 RepID=A0A1A9VI59_GLOAU